MEPAAMQCEKATCWRDREWPKSCREKFVHAWIEKLKHQYSAILSSQELDCQSAMGIPMQGNGAKDKPCLHLQRGAMLQPSENAIYVLTVKTAPQGRQYTHPVSYLANRHYSQKLPAPLSIRQLELLEKELASSSLDQETRAEEELLHICVSDLLLGSTERKRPRLLPPNRKMHMEVWKEKASQPLQEGERSPVPLEYSHLVDAMAVTNPADLPEVESFYRRFSPWLRQQGPHRRVRPVRPPGECPASAGSLEAATYQQSNIRTTKMSHSRQLLYSPKANVSLCDLTMATKESTSQNGHLPPKKRYSQSCV